MRKRITENRQPTTLAYESLELRQMLAFASIDYLPPNPRLHLPQDTTTVVQTGLDRAPDIAQSPEHGELQFNSDTGTLTYRPDAGFTGADTFQLANQTYNLRVWEPVYAVSDWAHVRPGTSATLDVLDNDYSLRESSFGFMNGNTDFYWQRDSSGFRIVDFTSGSANVSISADGRSLNYIPGNGFLGTDNLTYTLEDALGNRSQATVTIDVSHLNGQYFFSDAQWRQQRIDNWLENHAGYLTNSWNYGVCGDWNFDTIVSVPGMNSSNANFALITNPSSHNQVPNVNEGDIVQSQGSLIYYVTHHDGRNLGQGEFASYLSIIDVSNPDTPTVVSTTGFTKRIQDMFLGAGRVAIVFGQESSVENFENIQPARSGLFFSSNESQFELLVLDSTNLRTPTEVYRATMDGIYREGRLIGDELYVISESPVDSAPGPHLIDDSTVVVSPGEYIDALIRRDPNLNLPSITVHSGGQTTTITAGAHQIVDRENTGSTTSVATFNLQSSNGIPADFDVVETNSVQTIYVSENAIYLFDFQSVIKMSFVVDGAGVEFAADGELRGYVLSQFSADEHEGYLRVALTDAEDGSSDIRIFNQVDDQLVVVGSLEDIAPGERIYSTRFAEDRVFVVTFRVVDPLFVIDLSNPQTPTVTGELKIPGVSGYLQLIGDDLLLAIGRDVDENSNWFGDLQISLFDVSDLTSPKLLDQYTFRGGLSTTTPLMNWVGSAPNQQALTFDPKTGILALPIYSVESWANFDVPIFENGASAISLFRVDRENGIQVAGQADFKGHALRTVIAGENLVYMSAEGLMVADRSAPSRILSSMRFSTDKATPLAVRHSSPAEEVPVDTVPIEEVPIENLPVEIVPEIAPPVDSIVDQQPPADICYAPVETDPALPELVIADLVEALPIPASDPVSDEAPIPARVPALDLALDLFDFDHNRIAFNSYKSDRSTDVRLGARENNRGSDFFEIGSGKQTVTGVGPSFAIDETRNDRKSNDRAAYDAIFAELDLSTDLQLLAIVL